MKIRFSISPIAAPPRGGQFLSYLLLYCLYVCTMIHTYTGQIMEENEYAGMHPWEMSGVGLFYLAVVVIFCALIASRHTGRPSDYFVFFYLSIPLLTFAALFSASGQLTESDIPLSLLILAFPVLPLLAARRFFPNIRFSGLFQSANVDRALIGLLVIIIGFSAASAPASAGFDILTSYDRRLEGRTIFAEGSLLAYAASICMNGVSPFVSFRGAINRKPFLASLSLISTVFYFWLVGVKAPFFYSVVAYCLGVLVLRGKLTILLKSFLIGTIIMYVVVLLEWLLNEGHSIVADYLFRRLFAVQAEVQGYYLAFLFDKKDINWHWFLGSYDTSFEVSYYVGWQYFGNTASNANTNAFLYAVTSNGVLGYIFAIAVVSIFLSAIDRLHKSSKNPSYIIIGLLYGVLLTEQAFSTALVSSGIATLVLIAMCERPKEFSTRNVRTDAHFASNSGAPRQS